MANPLDLRHLRYFIAVAEEGSLRRAADRLFVSQPPLSRQIQDLERIVGSQLLVRSAAGVVLTDAGRVLLGRARRIVGECDALLEAVRKSGKAADDALRIGVSMALHASERKALATAWNKSAGKTEVLPGHSTELLADLRRGQIVLALIGLPADLEGLQSQVIGSVPVVIAVPRTHPAARLRKVSLHDMGDLPLFWFPRGYNPPYHDHCKKAFRAAGFAPRIVTVPPGQIMTLERIAAGEGWTLQTATYARTKVPGIVYRPLAEEALFAIRIAAVWRTQEPAGGQLAQLAARVLAGPGTRKPSR